MAPTSTRCRSRSTEGSNICWRRRARPARSWAPIATRSSARSRSPSAACASSPSAAISHSCGRAPPRRSKRSRSEGAWPNAACALLLLRSFPRKRESRSTCSRPWVPAFAGTNGCLRGLRATGHALAGINLLRQAIENLRQLSRNGARLDIEHAIAPRDQPSAALGTRSSRALAFLLREKIDHQPQRKRDKIGDMRSDRDLPLDALVGKAPVGGERVPKRALGVGRVAAQEPREPARRAGFARCVAVLGDERAQRGRFLAVEHTAARGSFATFAERDDDAV